MRKPSRESGWRETNQMEGGYKQAWEAGACRQHEEISGNRVKQKTGPLMDAAQLSILNRLGLGGHMCFLEENLPPES